MGRAALLSVLISLPFLPLSPAATLGSEPPPACAPDGPLGETTIERCLFGEGRIVVRYKGELHVLHEGDAVPGTGLVVARITAKQAALAEKPNGGAPAPQAGEGRAVLITGKPGGGWTVRAVRETPAEARQALPKAPPASTEKPKAASVP